MNENSNAIITLCSHLCVGENIAPLEPKEWSELAKKLMHFGLQPKDLLVLSKSELIDTIEMSPDFAERVLRLVDRNASLSFEISEYKNIGISIITRADEMYPIKLKKVLNNNCPPLFYCAGDVSLLNEQYIGYVGSRTITDDDIAFTENTVTKTVANGYGVVSGGAKGVDTISEEKALSLDAFVVEYLSDSMIKKIRKNSVIKALRNKKMVLLSAVKPDAPFNVGVAMMRNKYIYAQSSGTIIVRSEYNKGGTWAGAMENLKNNYCVEICRDKKIYHGNNALIQNGAIPIGDDWDGNVEALSQNYAHHKSEQMSLF